MKKILVCMMVLALCLCATISSFAADATGLKPDGTGSEDVKITVNGDIVHVYSVDVTFTDNPTFVYSSGRTWDPDNYVYADSDTHEWRGKGVVEIINHSDLPVKYTVESEVTEKNTYGPLSIKVVDKGTGTIDKCNVGDVRGSHNATAEYTVEGKPTVSSVDAAKLGTITVTIATAPEEP